MESLLTGKAVVRLADGSEWQIKVNMNVLCDFEAATGVNCLTKSLLESLNLTQARLLLFLCLRSEGAPYRTAEEVGALVKQGQMLIDVIRALVAGYLASMPQKEDTEGEEAPGEPRAAD